MQIIFEKRRMKDHRHVQSIIQFALCNLHNAICIIAEFFIIRIFA